MSIKGIPAALESRMRKRTTALEGGRYTHVYMDSKGHPTIGVGFNLDRGGARARLAMIGADYDKVRAGTEDLTAEQADNLFDGDFLASVAGARGAVKSFDRLENDAIVCVCDMAFNMGLGSASNGLGLMGFRQMLAALEEDPPDYETAAAELMDSDYARKDVPSRARANRDLLLACVRPGDHEPPKIA